MSGVERAGVIQGPEATERDPVALPRPYRYRAHSMVRWLSPLQVVRGAYGEFFGRLLGRFVDNRELQAGTRPPQSLLGVQRLVLPELLVEIEATAAE